jgi:hypothetical protein
LEPIPGVSNNFIGKISLKNLSFAIYLQYQLKNTNIFEKGNIFFVEIFSDENILSWPEVQQILSKTFYD